VEIVSVDDIDVVIVAAVEGDDEPASTGAVERDDELASPSC
jgi:hypothetical protein